MSETIIERAARTLYERFEKLDPGMGAQIPWTELTARDRQLYREAVQAVLEGIREPSETMKDAGSGAQLRESGYDESYHAWLAPDGAAECWRDMIDAAQAEQ